MSGSRLHKVSDAMAQKILDELKERGEFARLEKRYGPQTANLGPMSRGGWLAYWRSLEATEPK